MINTLFILQYYDSIVLAWRRLYPGSPWEDTYQFLYNFLNLQGLELKNKFPVLVLQICYLQSCSISQSLVNFFYFLSKHRSVFDKVHDDCEIQRHILSAHANIWVKLSILCLWEKPLSRQIRHVSKQHQRETWWLSSTTSTCMCVVHDHFDLNISMCWQNASLNFTIIMDLDQQAGKLSRKKIEKITHILTDRTALTQKITESS